MIINAFYWLPVKQLMYHPQVSNYLCRYLFECNRSFSFYPSVIVSVLRLFRYHSHKHISNGAYRLVSPHTRSRSTAQSVCRQILLMVDGSNIHSFSCSPIIAVWMVRNIHCHNRIGNAKQPNLHSYVLPLVPHIPTCQISVQSNLSVQILLW